MHNEVLFPSLNWIETAEMKDIILILNNIPIPETEFELKTCAMILEKGVMLIKENLMECVRKTEFPTDGDRLLMESFAEVMLKMKLKIVFAVKLDEFIISTNKEMFGVINKVTDALLDTKVDESDNVIKFPKVKKLRKEKQK